MSAAGFELWHLALWLLLGWLGAFVLWYDRQRQSFRPGLVRTALCAALVVSGPAALVLGPLFAIAETRMKKRRRRRQSASEPAR